VRSIPLSHADYDKEKSKVTAIAVEKYNIKGFRAPRPITSETQNEHYTEVLYNLERSA
jgi:hypothetical protein